VCSKYNAGSTIKEAPLELNKAVCANDLTGYRAYQVRVRNCNPNTLFAEARRDVCGFAHAAQSRAIDYGSIRLSCAGIICSRPRVARNGLTKKCDAF
jgi:hypothetical protein